MFGGRFSQVLAAYLDLHLRLMRPNTVAYAPHSNTNPALLADMGKRSVCVVFDFRRYQRDTIALAKAASEHGARIILFTDPWLSPAADFANTVLTAHVDAAGSFDSIVAPTALVEALVFAVHARLGATAEQRMRSIEADFEDNRRLINRPGSTNPLPGSAVSASSAALGSVKDPVRALQHALHRRSCAE